MKKKWCDVGNHECDKLFHARTKERLSSCALHVPRTPIKPKVGDIIEYNHTAYNGEIERHQGRVVSITSSNKPPTATKKSKPINKVSAKMKERLSQYKAVRIYYLLGHPNCEAQLENCSVEATDIHHMKGRGGDLLLNMNFFIALCRGCHLWVESHPKQAKELGLSIERLKK